jgi:hypothetical protein
MADLGRTIANGWGAGRAIGDDIADWRMRRGEGRIREKYEQMAASEGKTLEEYLPQIEQELQKLGSGMFGADRRGVADANGQPLSSGALGRISELARTASTRRAGEMALSGDQAGARGALATSAYRRGDFDAGQQQQIAQQQIGATTGALRPDGTYDMAAGRQALAGTAARFGDAAAAEQSQQGANTFRLQAARAKADSLFNMVQNLDKFSPDQIAGTWEGFKESVPELANVDVRKGDDGQLYIYTGGKPTGSINPGDKADLEELATMMAQFTKAPGEALGGYMQQRMTNITQQREEDSKFSGKIDDAIIKVITEGKTVGIPDGVLSKVTSASTGTGDSKGWQLQEMGEDPGSFLMQKGGQVYVVKTNVPADPKTGLGAAPVQVFEADGVTPVNPEALNSADKAGFDYTLSAVKDMMSLGNAQQIEWMKSQIGALNEFRNTRLGTGGAGDTGGAPSGGRSGGPSRGDRNNNPGNIEDRGQFKGQPGYLGSDGRFARFETREQGMAAMHNQLQRYMEGKTTGQPLRSVSEIVPTWSPQSDPTNEAGSTDNYLQYVAKRLGVDPNAPLTPDQIPALAEAMVEFETGNTQGAPQQAIAAAPAAAQPRAATAPVRATPAPARAPAAPAPRRAGISEDYLRTAAVETRAAGERYAKARDSLQRFVEENPPDTRRSAISTGAGGFGMGTGGLGAGVLGYSDPVMQRVYERLQREAAEAERVAKETTAETKGNTAAFRRDRQNRAIDSQAEDLYSRYGGTGNYGGASR